MYNLSNSMTTMKTKDIFRGLTALLFAGVLFTACDDDDNNWSPGPVVGDGTQNFVYFVNTPDAEELDANITQDYAITVVRIDSTEAITVPFVVSDTVNFDTPTSVSFPAGVGTVHFTVHFKGAPDSGSFPFSLVIEDERYSSPYTQYVQRVDLPQEVSKWELLASNVQFEEYYGNLPSFTCDLYQTTNHTKYSFVDFAEGYDLRFTAKESVPGLGYYITPSGGSKYSDSYWYFGDDYWNNSFPLQLKNSEYYADYSYIYTNYSYTTINFATRSGWLLCYFYLYDAEGTYQSENWIYYTFSWTKEDELKADNEAN
jgi:hypothetical protein